MRNHIDVTMSDSTADYLTACARIRNLNRTSLVRRLLDVIAKDMLVAGILDDENLRAKRPSQHKFKRANHVQD